MKDNNNFILSGRYEILKPLGCGSNGTVYLARYQSLGIDRAVKVFPKSDAQSPFAVSEAQILKETTDEMESGVLMYYAK